MILLCRFVAVSMLGLAVGALAQTSQPSEPGAGSIQVAPASAAPVAHAQPKLRTDSMPHTNQDASTDSAPLPETLGMDATPLMDMGMDWSRLATSEQPTLLKRVVTNKQGQTSVIEVQTLPRVTLPVTNPPEPPSRIIADIPQPLIERKPTPPDPLTGIPQ